jgi:predicted nucleic acid-binding protein
MAMEAKQKIVLDSSAVIGYLNKEAGAPDLPAIMRDRASYISVITRMELLAQSTITLEKEVKVHSFLADKIKVLPLTESIEQEAIAFRRATHRKLPDAIIAATAVVLGAEVVSTDPHLLKCTSPSLRVYAGA